MRVIMHREIAIALPVELAVTPDESKVPASALYASSRVLMVAAGTAEGVSDPASTVL